MVGGFQGVVDAILNPVFGWLLDIPSIVAILFLSLLLGLVSTLLQKYVTDQSKMRRLKADTKKLQEQLKAAQKARDMDKLTKLQQKLMPLQMDMMRESFRPLIFSMVPFLVIFFWLSTHFAFYPVTPDTPFAVSATFSEGLSGNATLESTTLAIDAATQAITDGVAHWKVVGPAGIHALSLTYAGATATREVLITNDREYLRPELALKGPVEKFTVHHEKIVPVPGFWVPWGDHRAGWIFWYILFSIPLSLLLKKLLNVV